MIGVKFIRMKDNEYRSVKDVKYIRGGNDHCPYTKIRFVGDKQTYYSTYAAQRILDVLTNKHDMIVNTEWNNDLNLYVKDKDGNLKRLIEEES